MKSSHFSLLKLSQQAIPIECVEMGDAVGPSEWQTARLLRWTNPPGLMIHFSTTGQAFCKPA